MSSSPPEIVQPSSHPSSLALTLPAVLLAAPLLGIALAILIAASAYYFKENYSDGFYIDYQAANDYMADSGNFDHTAWLDEKLLAQRRIVITTDVNPQLSKRIVASLILLDQLDPELPIHLYLRTEGGWLSDAFAVVDAMQAIKAPVNVYSMGGTSSAGAIILCAGTGRRVALPQSLIMVHDNLSEPGKSPYDSDRQHNARLRAFWKERAKLPPDWFIESGDESHYLNAKQALEFGIIDEIVEKF
ncbi:MAG: ClpP family protease [Candidatus Methylacidiphilales bacterium]